MKTIKNETWTDEHPNNVYTLPFKSAWPYPGMKRAFNLIDKCFNLMLTANYLHALTKMAAAYVLKFL